jgi:hypothetical protein
LVSDADSLNNSFSSATSDATNTSNSPGISSVSRSNESSSGSSGSGDVKPAQLARMTSLNGETSVMQVENITVPRPSSFLSVVREKVALNRERHAQAQQEAAYQEQQ